MLIVGGMIDHVHALCQIPAKISPAEAVQKIKANSSRWLRGDKGRRHFQWQESYGAFTVSPSQVDSVYRYIARQEEHHRRKTFAEEYREFLKRADIEFDEKHLL